MRAFREFLRLRRSDERGAVLVFVAIALVVMLGSAALAVDVGQVTNNNRNLQAEADSIALDTGRALSGQTAAQLSGASGAAVLAAQQSAVRNSVATSNLTVDLGTLSGSTFTTIATPILNGNVQSVVSNSVPKAVRVTASGTVRFAFDIWNRGSKTTTRSSIATMDNSAGFSIGSWLASVSGSNSILGGLFGDAFHLNVVSYNGLVNGNVTLQALGLNMPASVGVLSPTQLLTTSVSINNFMLASIAALNAQGNTTAVNVLNSMLVNASTTGTVKLGDFINVAAGGDNAAASASLNVLQLLTASAMVMEKNGGHALSIPTATISIPGIASVTASATVIEPAQIYFGPVGGSVSTAQVRLSINPVINIGTNPASNTTPCNLTLSNLLGLVGCLLYLVGMPIGVTINGSLPIDLTAAGATGTLSAINCAAPSITVSSTTQAVNLNAAANLNVNVTLAGNTVLNAAQVNIAAGAKTTPFTTSTSFAYPNEFGPSNAKSVGPSSLGLSGLLNVTSANVSVLNSSLLSGVTSGLIQGLVTPLLNSLLGSLDTALTVPLQVLGVKLGGADIAALGYACNGLRLAG